MNEKFEAWDRFYLGLAKYYSTKSKDPSTKVGAALINYNRVVGIGYNGFPVGIADTEERLSNRDLKYKLVVHAEMNALLQAGRDAFGATLYVYPSFALPPICTECAKHAIQAGVRTIVGYEPTPEAAERAKRWQGSIDFARMMWLEVGGIWRSYQE